jgi:hypothetical protein
MKITDKGLERILSLGLMKSTESSGVYFLYSWKSVDYYCGLPSAKNHFSFSGVFVSLTEDQFDSLPIKENKSSNDPKLKQLCEYFQTVAFLKFDAKTESLRVKDYSGHNTKASFLEINMSDASPFTIAKETAKEFHGFVNPSPKCRDSLEKAYFKTDKLWITAVPIFKANVFVGVLAGFSQDKEYGLDVLKFFKNYQLKAA